MDEEEAQEDFLAKLNIRRLTDGDLDAIIEIDRKVLGKPRWDYWKKISFSNARYSQSCLAAEFEGKVVGFILGEVSGWEFGVPDSISWINTIGVDPDFQHSGIAKKLSQEFMKSLRAINVNTVYTLVNWNDWDLLNFFVEWDLQEEGI